MKIIRGSHQHAIILQKDSENIPLNELSTLVEFVGGIKKEAKFGFFGSIKEPARIRGKKNENGSFTLEARTGTIFGIAYKYLFSGSKKAINQRENAKEFILSILNKQTVETDEGNELISKITSQLEDTKKEFDRKNIYINLNSLLNSLNKNNLQNYSNSVEKHKEVELTNEEKNIQENLIDSSNNSESDSLFPKPQSINSLKNKIDVNSLEIDHFIFTDNLKLNDGSPESSEGIESNVQLMKNDAVILTDNSPAGSNSQNENTINDEKNILENLLVSSNKINSDSLMFEELPNNNNKSESDANSINQNHFNPTGNINPKNSSLQGNERVESDEIKTENDDANLLRISITGRISPIENTIVISSIEMDENNGTDILSIPVGLSTGSKPPIERLNVDFFIVPSGYIFGRGVVINKNNAKDILDINNFSGDYVNKNFNAKFKGFFLNKPSEAPLNFTDQTRLKLNNYKKELSKIYTTALENLLTGSDDLNENINIALIPIISNKLKPLQIEIEVIAEVIFNFQKNNFGKFNIRIATEYSSVSDGIKSIFLKLNT